VSPATRPVTGRRDHPAHRGGCPLKDTLTKDTTAALMKVEGVTGVEVTLGVMSDEQRAS
jgi:metal-sulfur cluster biosynthetic enzyme